MVNERGGIEADLIVSTIESGDGNPCDPKFIGCVRLAPLPINNLGIPVRSNFHFLVLLGKGYYITVAGGSAFQNYAHILKVVQDKRFNVQITDLTEDMGLLSIQGPKRYTLYRACLLLFCFKDNSFE